MIYGNRFLLQERYYKYYSDPDPKKLSIADKSANVLNDMFKNNGFANVKILDNTISYTTMINNSFMCKNGNKFGYWAISKSDTVKEDYDVLKWIRNNTEKMKEAVQNATKCDVLKIKLDINSNINKKNKSITSYVIIYITYDLK